LILGQVLGVLMAYPNLLADRLSVPVDPAVMALAGFGIASLLIGVVAGLALRGASWVIRLGVALFGMVVALIAFNVVYGLLRGLPLAAALMGMRDELKLGQAALGLLGAGLGTLAGRAASGVSVSPAPARRSTGRQAAARSRQPAQAAARSTGSGGTSRGGRGGTREAREARNAASARTARQTTGHGNRRRTTARASASAASAPAAASISVGGAKPAKPAKKRKSIFSRRKAVHLGREQSAMCPFCLEEVRPNDPRGKVVCRICGSPHHADCWAITGKCEVPHLQT
jgi:hypothetical protein